MRFGMSSIVNFGNRYKRLKFNVVKNTETGNYDWEVYNYLGKKVLNYKGAKTSIFLVNKIYTVDSNRKEALEAHLNELLIKHGGEIVQD